MEGGGGGGGKNPVINSSAVTGLRRVRHVALQV